MATATLEAPVTDNEEDVTEENLQQKKNRLRNEAEREVIDNHRDELNTITEAKFVAEGIKYTRRLTEKEKAKKRIDDLFNEYPDLRDEYAAH